jgi:hypothetical protein
MTQLGLTSREEQILDILKQIYPNKDKFTLIGGYAVDAYSPQPRYSQDCDLVISESDYKGFEKILNEQGFVVKERINRDQQVDGVVKTWKFRKFVNKQRVEVDLLIDAVKCRQTDAIWTEQEIKSGSGERRVVGLSDTVNSNVASKELLIAMKLHSGRDPDLRDVVMLQDSVDWDLVAKFTTKGSKQKVLDQLDNALKNIQREQFETSIKASFYTKESQGKRISLALTNIERLKEKLASSSF